MSREQIASSIHDSSMSACVAAQLDFSNGAMTAGSFRCAAQGASARLFAMHVREIASRLACALFRATAKLMKSAVKMPRKREKCREAQCVWIMVVVVDCNVQICRCQPPTVYPKKARATKLFRHR